SKQGQLCWRRRLSVETAQPQGARSIGAGAVGSDVTRGMEALGKHAMARRADTAGAHLDAAGGAGDLKHGVTRPFPVTAGLEAMHDHPCRRSHSEKASSIKRFSAVMVTAGTLRPSSRARRLHRLTMRSAI